MSKSILFILTPEYSEMKKRVGFVNELAASGKPFLGVSVAVSLQLIGRMGKNES